MEKHSRSQQLHQPNVEVQQKKVQDVKKRQKIPMEDVIYTNN
ncbi:hypothetical protein [Flavobacterium sp.]|jgi:hypothetical protein